MSAGCDACCTRTSRTTRNHELTCRLTRTRRSLARSLRRAMVALWRFRRSAGCITGTNGRRPDPDPDCSTHTHQPESPRTQTAPSIGMATPARDFANRINALMLTEPHFQKARHHPGFDEIEFLVATGILERVRPIASPPSGAPTRRGGQARDWPAPRRARQAPDRRRRRSAPGR